jgi:X-Pro dipeptidyl-peptidase C-terminal non-catalytic domain
MRSCAEVLPKSISQSCTEPKNAQTVSLPPEGLPSEQSSDDRKSLLFDSGPLGADIEILGHPIARIRVAADQPVAKLALRLCEVTPAGESRLVTYGVLNLTHRDGNAEPVALTPDQAYDVTIELSLIAHRFKAGNRIARDPSFPIPVNAAAAQAPGGRTPLREAGPDADGWYEIRQDPEAYSYPLADTACSSNVRIRLRFRAI